jgi:hypothetical protein
MRREKNMRYILMHRDVPVLDIGIDRETKVIADTGGVHNKARLPPGVFHEGAVERARLNQWWALRGVPASRDGIGEALEILKLENTGELALEGLGIGLSDHYWIRPEESVLKWEDVNYYSHEFSQDIGDALFGKIPQNRKVDFLSPDAASNGNLKKNMKLRRRVLRASNQYKRAPPPPQSSIPKKRPKRRPRPFPQNAASKLRPPTPKPRKRNPVDADPNPKSNNIPYRLFG